MRTYLALAAALVFSVAPSAAAPADPQQVDLKALVETGAKTLQRLRTTPASWSVSNTLPSGAVITVSVLRAGEKQRTVFTVDSGGQRVEVLRLISRDGLWYATDRAGSYKHRPFEVPVETPFIYLCLSRAEPMFVTEEHPILGDKLESVDANVATFRQPLPPEKAGPLQALVEGMEASAREGGRPLTPEARRQTTAILDMLAKGTSTRVDLSTGRIMEYGTERLRSRVTDFRFLPQVEEREFAVEGRQWQDYSDDPTAGNLEDLVMIGHHPGVQPGAKKYDLDGRLMDVRTGRFRRIPFQGGVVMPGCFLRDRRSVVVTGLDPETGAVRSYQIDLKTRQSRALGGALLESGVTLGADLSPDGRTVAVLHLDPSGNLLRSQVCLIDLATGDAKPLGKPMDTAFVSWTADGRLVLLHRQYKDPDSPAVTSLAVMDMQGTVTVLRRGNHPVPLADRQTILFEDPDTRLWYTCDLKGKNVKLFADGLKGYGFPAPAPDGKRILMMRFNPPALPEPVVLEVGQPEGRVITRTAGLWGIPTWR